MKTGEVKWFDGTGKEAIDMAASHWGEGNLMTGADKPEEFQNLGSSFFGPTKGGLFDQEQILDQQKSYLTEVAAKINDNAGVKVGEFGNMNNITYEYLSSKFLGSSFGNNKNNSSDILGLAWDFGGADLLESKLPKNILTKVGMLGLDAFFSSQPTALSADKSYMDRVRSVNEFKNQTLKTIDMKTIINIRLHKF